MFLCLFFNFLAECLLSTDHRIRRNPPGIIKFYDSTFLFFFSLPRFWQYFIQSNGSKKKINPTHFIVVIFKLFNENDIKIYQTSVWIFLKCWKKNVNRERSRTKPDMSELNCVYKRALDIFAVSADTDHGIVPQPTRKIINPSRFWRDDRCIRVIPSKKKKEINAFVLKWEFPRSGAKPDRTNYLFCVLPVSNLIKLINQSNKWSY